MKNIFLAFLVLLSSTSYAKVLWKGDFETGDFSQWSPYWQAQDYSRFALRTDITAPGSKYAASFTVKNGDIHSSGSRAEFLLHGLKVNGVLDKVSEGDEIWYRWQTMFPADFKSDTKWQVWTQWHDWGLGVPVGFELHGEVVDLRINGSWYDRQKNWKGGIVWKAPLVRGRWQDFVFHIKFHRDPTQGFVELWVDGEQVVQKTYDSTLDPDYPEPAVYLKQGFYRHKDILHDQTIYHDGMTMATSRDDVLPIVIVEPEPEPEPEPDAGDVEVDAGTDPEPEPDPEPDAGVDGEPDAGPDTKEPIVTPDAGVDDDDVKVTWGCSSGDAGPWIISSLLGILAFLVIIRRGSERY